VSPAPEQPVRGSCLCGGVRYEVTAPFRRANYCHCSRCRKHSGGSASAQGRVPREGFRLVSGAELIPEGPEVSIRFGTLDDDPGIRPQFHSFVDSKAAWEELSDAGPLPSLRPGGSMWRSRRGGERAQR
jgi:hypothetical protein